MPASSANIDVAKFTIVRLALLVGVLLFGGVVFFLLQNGSLEPSMTEDDAQPIRMAWYALFLGVLAGMGFVRKKALAPKTFAKRAPFLLVGYALAESVALFGGVLLLLTGAYYYYLIGLLLFLAAFLVFPVTDPERP